MQITLIYTIGLAYKKIFDEVINKERRNKLELYRIISQDDFFKIAIQDTIKQMLGV